MTTGDDHRFMMRAVSLAARGLNACHPNPRVGCVLVRDNEIVGEGWHRRAGEAHAEALAIAAANGRASGATAYVTLEPCCHDGKTPPCSNALIAAGVERVVVGTRDPNPQVAGGGIRMLEEAGIAVETGILEDATRALNPGFLRRMEGGRPHVRVKIAASLDGRTAMADGESKWITGSAARRDVHKYRALSDVIVTGIATVLADDPRMTVRLDDSETSPWVQPARVVLDTNLRMPADARMLAAGGPVSVFHGPGAARSDGSFAAREFDVDAGGRVDPAACIDALGDRGHNNVLVEAGPTLNGALLHAGLVDEIVLYQASVLMGDEARGMFTLPSLGNMSERIRLHVVDVTRVGDDWKWIIKPD